VYGQSSLIPSPSEDHARYVASLAGELERTLETADGVVGARVHLVLGQPDSLLAAGDKPPPAARAAVMLKVAAGQPPLPVADVQRLIAGSVPGLDVSAVTVVVTSAAVTTSAPVGPLTSLGPLRVTPSSRPLLLALFAVGLGLIGALATLLFIALRRRALPPES